MKRSELVIEKGLSLVGLIALVILLLIFLFLFGQGLMAFKTVNPLQFFFGHEWYPTSDPARFGTVPLVLGSLLITLGALMISVPLGVAVAVYIAEIAPGRIRETLKPVVELLAAFPSVVIGFLGIVVLAPAIQELFNLPTGFTALAGSVTLAFMALPTIISIAEDALRSVPDSYREASLALGASRWETVCRCVVPAAKWGILAAVMLGIGRVIGETMTVLMVTGNAAVIPSSLLQSTRTLTATIAAEMGETVQYSEHYYALFALGAMLFMISFGMNLIVELLFPKQSEVR